MIGLSHSSADDGHSNASNSPLHRSDVVVVIVLSVVVDVVTSQVLHKIGHFSIKISPKIPFRQSLPL